MPDNLLFTEETSTPLTKNETKNKKSSATFPCCTFFFLRRLSSFAVHSWLLCFSTSDRIIYSPINKEQERWYAGVWDRRCRVDLFRVIKRLEVLFTDGDDIFERGNPKWYVTLKQPTLCGSWRIISIHYRKHQKVFRSQEDFSLCSHECGTLLINFLKFQMRETQTF